MHLHLCPEASLYASRIDPRSCISPVISSDAVYNVSFLCHSSICCIDVLHCETIEVYGLSFGFVKKGGAVSCSNCLRLGMRDRSLFSSCRIIIVPLRVQVSSICLMCFICLASKNNFD